MSFWYTWSIHPPLLDGVGLSAEKMLLPWMETSASRCLSMVASHVSLSPMMSKCSIFERSIISSIFGGSDWTLAESTLSMFGCVHVCCGGGGGDGGDGCGGSDGSGGDGSGGDGGGEACFDGLFIGFSLELRRLPHFPTMRVRTFWSRNEPVLLF